MKSKNQKCTEAAIRVAEWRSLTPSQQLTALNHRLGTGIGAKRQRTKLAACQDPVVPATIVPVAEAAPARVFTSKAEERRFNHQTQSRKAK